MKVLDNTNYSIIPVSVIDVEPLGVKGIRGVEKHDKDSSRKNFSAFPKSVATLCAEFFLRDSEIVLDPFAGWGERGEAVQAAGKEYRGFDTSEEAVDSCASRGVDIVMDNSATALIPHHDGLLTCPPYWNLEKYSGFGCHRARSWEDFLEEFDLVLTRCREKAAPGSTYCVMVGDWRSGGEYYDLTFQTEKMLWRLDMKPHDKVVVSRKTISKIKIMLPQAKRLGYTVKVHENLLVYRT